MGRNNKDFSHGIESIAVRHPDNPNDVLINRFPALKDPKDWVPQTLAVTDKETVNKMEKDWDN